MKCVACEGKGYVSGGEVSGGWHVPSHCYDCVGLGFVAEGHVRVEFRQPLPKDQHSPDMQRAYDAYEGPICRQGRDD